MEIPVLFTLVEKVAKISKIICAVLKHCVYYCVVTQRY